MKCGQNTAAKACLCYCFQCVSNCHKITITQSGERVYSWGSPGLGVPDTHTEKPHV